MAHAYIHAGVYHNECYNDHIYQSIWDTAVPATVTGSGKYL